MRTKWGFLLVCATVIASAAPGRPRLEAAPLPTGQAALEQAAEHRETVNVYCEGCHNQVAQIADLALDALDIANPSEDAEI